MRRRRRIGVVCVVALGLACTPPEEATDAGTTSGTGSASGSASESTTAAGSSTTEGADDSSTSAAPTSESTAAVDDDSDSSEGSSETTSSPPEVDCTWLEQPGADREWGRCTPAMAFDDAEAACVGEGGHLVSFDGASDNLFAINVLDGSGEAWIGLNDQARADAYAWTDGTPYAYMNWEDGQPDSADDRCVALGNSQRWFDYPCEESRIFLCARAL